MSPGASNGANPNPRCAPATGACFARLGVPIDADDDDALVLFPEMDARADAPEITESCWDTLGAAPEAMMCASARMVVKRRGAERAVLVPLHPSSLRPEIEMGDSLARAGETVALNHPHCAALLRARRRGVQRRAGAGHCAAAGAGCAVNERACAIQRRDARDRGDGANPSISAERSSPPEGPYLFAYRVRIPQPAATKRSSCATATGGSPTPTGARRKSTAKAWSGEQPVLAPGESFEYTSGTPLATASGIMLGSYEMVTGDGERLVDVTIPALFAGRPRRRPARQLTASATCATSPAPRRRRNRAATRPKPPFAP